MPAGVIPVTGLTIGPVGRISNTDFPIVTPRVLNATDTLSANFGDALVLNANNSYSTVAQFILNGGTLASTTPLAVAQGDIHTNPYYPLVGGTAMPGGIYTPGMVVDGVTRGTINVLVTNGTTFSAGGAVYIRHALNAEIPAGVIGGFEASADGANSIAITNMVWKTGMISPDGVAQLTLLNRMMA